MRIRFVQLPVGPSLVLKDNDYVYVLFYSAKGRLNIDISAKFEQLAREWKWSRIHFGRIDVDKEIAPSRWVFHVEEQLRTNQK